eukprot:comp15103_c1_seq1/m.11760 comp15103_c1_seq1/g.11760  ORF comp15103_c1_seq1/g.11760 comp15103_c1_seq1/m.11760 type:complete len:103 (-) comp15103_c1_seq1:129-437(-)
MWWLHADTEQERSGRIFVGVVVWAYYHDQYPYTGCIVKQNTDGTYTVHFNDGDVRLRVPVDEINLEEEMPGTLRWRLMANHDKICSRCGALAELFPRNMRSA